MFEPSLAGSPAFATTCKSEGVMLPFFEHRSAAMPCTIVRPHRHGSSSQWQRTDLLLALVDLVRLPFLATTHRAVFDIGTKRHGIVALGHHSDGLSHYCSPISSLYCSHCSQRTLFITGKWFSTSQTKLINVHSQQTVNLVLFIR